MIKGIVKARTTKDIIIEILTFVLTILVSTFVLRYTWNNSLTPSCFLFLFKLLEVFKPP